MMFMDKLTTILTRIFASRTNSRTVREIKLKNMREVEILAYVQR